MYDVFIKNGNISQNLHLHDTANRNEKIATGTITEEINAISSFSFTIYSNNPCYDKLNPYTTYVEVYNTNRHRYDFKGRVLKVSPQMDEDGAIYKNVVCESQLGYLCDSIQPYTEIRQYEGDTTRNGLQEFIDLILENHNKQVEPNKKIYRGVVTVNPHETSDGVYKGLNYEKTFDVIKNKLIGSFGGEVNISEKNGLLYLDYVPKFGSTRATTIELSKNIQNQSRNIDPSNIISRLIPLGAKLKVKETDDNGNEIEKETEERLKITSINNGVDYIEDSLSLAKYGVIYGTKVFDDVTLPANLKAKGEDFLSENNRVDIADTITALDLSQIGLDIDDFALYDSYPTSNKLLGIIDTLRIVKKTTNIIEAYASSFQLGNHSKSMNDIVIDYETSIQDILRYESERETEIFNSNQDIISYSEKYASSMKLTEEEIQAAVEKTTVSKSTYDTFEQLVKHILSIDENGTTMIFETINKAITEVDGNAQSNYNRILKYIRFIDGNIVLGQEGNDMTLTISNNRVSFKQNGVEVAYMSDNNLYIGNAVIKAGGQLQLGNFAFVPRDDGSLSFLKVGG